MANATFFLFFVAHNAAGSQGVNERTKKGKKKTIIRDQETGMFIWNSFQPARKKERSLCERVVRDGIQVAGGQILSGEGSIL